MEAVELRERIQRLHDAAVAAHRARRDVLLAQEAYQEMRASLQDAPPYCTTETAIRAELGLA